MGEEVKVKSAEVKIQKLDKKAMIPNYGSRCAAGVDLSAVIKDTGTDGGITIKPCETKKVGTGIAVEIPDGYFGAIFARSGMATKRGLRPANCVGVIDSDYRGELIVALHNDSDVEQTIYDGDRIAQLVIMPYLAVNFKMVAELDDTERGNGGFGSTGENIAGQLSFGKDMQIYG